MTFQAHFAENLMRHRKRAGLTQEEVAIRASVHRSMLSKYEDGPVVPHLDIIIRLGGALSISPADLLDGITYRPSFIGMGPGKHRIADSENDEATSPRIASAKRE